MKHLKSFGQFLFGFVFSTLFIGLMPSIGHAQEENFTVATGDRVTSVYTLMYNDIARFCGKTISMVPVYTNGGVANAQLLTTNKVNGAILPSDLLFYYKSTDPAKVKNIFALFSLHPEELHFVAPSFVKAGGMFSAIRSKIQLTDVRGLADRRVGAVGGSVVSARIFASKAKINYTVAEYLSNDALIKALQSGDIDAALIVGGAQHPAVEALNTNYTLLPVPADIITALTVGEGALYKPASLTYVNLAATGVKTVATDAVFTTRTYRSANMNTKLTALRNCLGTHLPDIQDATGTHAKWQVVASDQLTNPAMRTKWQWYVPQ